MTLDEARALIGCKVVYRAPHVKPDERGEEGVVTSVNKAYVFVRYGAACTSSAAEGFPELTPAEFMRRYFEPQHIGPMDDVTRIEWRYLDDFASAAEPFSVSVEQTT